MSCAPPVPVCRRFYKYTHAMTAANKKNEADFTCTVVRYHEQQRSPNIQTFAPYTHYLRFTMCPVIHSFVCIINSTIVCA